MRALAIGFLGVLIPVITLLLAAKAFAPPVRVEQASVLQRVELLERRVGALENRGAGGALPLAGSAPSAAAASTPAAAPARLASAPASVPEDAPAGELQTGDTVLPESIAETGSSIESIEALYRRYGADVKRLKRTVMTWANKTDLHQGVEDVEAEIMYMRIRALRPARVAELGFGQGLASTYMLQALEDNGGAGRLYTFDIKDQWDRARTMPEALVHRWTLTLGDGRKTLDRFAPYAYVHSDAEHSTTFAQWLAVWLGKKQQRLAPSGQGASTLVSFHDVYKWLPKTAEGRCLMRMKRGNGITAEGAIMLKFARSRATHPPQDSFSVAPSHFPDNWARVQAARHAVGLDDDWVCDAAKYSDPKHFKKSWGQMTAECKRMQRERPNNPSIFFSV